jgi:glycosyltransferase involved in cell wall biosynthesis
VRVIAFTKYDREAASTRQRILQYHPALARSGIELDYRALLGDSYVRSLATGERPAIGSIVAAFVRRLADLLRKPDCDLIWVYAELFPYLPGWLERLVFRCGVPVVYDCDDAFFVRYNENSNWLVRALLQGKIEQLLAGATAATCGNEFLRDYVGRFCPNSIVLPTVVDTSVYRSTVRTSAEPVTIGWIGSPSTWPQVRPFLPLLEDICRSRGTIVRVIGAGKAAERDRFPGLELVEWSEATEIGEIQKVDIGIMPLFDSPFERGKSGYKLIQYMACGLPVVASPVGANCQIVTSETGLLASTEIEWRAALLRLIGDGDLRRSLGEKGRQRAVACYSLASQALRLIELLRTVADEFGKSGHSGESLSRA